MQENIKSVEKQIVAAESDGATASMPTDGTKFEASGVNAVREIVEELDENDNVICKSHGICRIMGLMVVSDCNFRSRGTGLTIKTDRGESQQIGRRIEWYPWQLFEDNFNFK